MENRNTSIAHFHLPGLFEFHEFYKVFIPFFYEHKEYFYDWVVIGSLYGSKADCIWGGGRVSDGVCDENEVLELIEEYGIDSRLTFSNSLLENRHLSDYKCNKLCELFNQMPNNGVIVHSDLLSSYIKNKYKNLYLVSSTTKTITDFNAFIAELDRPEFKYIVPDFRLNKSFEQLSKLNQNQKDKVEFLINECCSPSCKERKECYEHVSKLNLGIDCPAHICHSPHGNEGYRFSKAMENPMFISLNDIKNVYLPLGFSNFKIEGRGLGSAILLEFILYYMAKPEYHLIIREAIYLDSMLDLF